MDAADKVDYYSKLIFPASFALFNVILWSAYLRPSHLNYDSDDNP